MTLAHEFNEISYKDMLKKIDPDELAMWRVYFARYPFSDDRSDIAIGSLRHSVYAVSGCKNPPTLDDCIQNYGPKPKPKVVSGAVIKQKLGAFFKNLPVITKKRPKDVSN